MIVYDATRTTPSWAAGAADYLAGILESDDVVVEWGAGASTIWLAERVAHVIAAEHDQHWYNVVRGHDRPNVTLVRARRFTPDYVYEPLRVLRNMAGRRAVFAIDGWQRRTCLVAARREAATGDLFVCDDVLDYLEPGETIDGTELQKFVEPHPQAGAPFRGRKPVTSLYDRNPLTKETWIWRHHS